MARTRETEKKQKQEEQSNPKTRKKITWINTNMDKFTDINVV